MNTTSLEISKKLYEVSGWEDTDEYSYFTSDGKEYFGGMIDGCERVPRYELGYLLRKLPGLYNASRLTILWYGDKWEACYQGNGPLWERPPGSQAAKTPEDAAALLAIKLFEEGIIK